ncbi:MAG: hypothetical protein ACTSRC_22155 [Candidatus Helarchaeota archaeon]
MVDITEFREMVNNIIQQKKEITAIFSDLTTILRSTLEGTTTPNGEALVSKLNRAQQIERIVANQLKKLLTRIEDRFLRMGLAWVLHSTNAQLSIFIHVQPEDFTQVIPGRLQFIFTMIQLLGNAIDLEAKSLRITLQRALKLPQE